MATEYENLTYVGISITLTTANTVYNLGTLLRAAVANCPLAVKEANIQVDGSVPGTVRVGDGSLSLTQCGYTILTNGSRLYRNPTDSVPIGMLCVMPSVNAMVLNIELWQ